MNSPAGAEAVVEAHPVLVLGILARGRMYMYPAKLGLSYTAQVPPSTLMEFWQLIYVEVHTVAVAVIVAKP